MAVYTILFTPSIAAINERTIGIHFVASSFTITRRVSRDTWTWAADQVKITGQEIMRKLGETKPVAIGCVNHLNGHQRPHHWPCVEPRRVLFPAGHLAFSRASTIAK